MKTSLLFVLSFLSTFSNASDICPFGFTILSNNCTFKETIASTAVCSRYAHQLSEYYEEAYWSLKYAQNVTKLCDEMKSCFEKSPCEGVRLTGKIYEERCDKVELNSYRMIKCLRKYYEARDYGKVSCMLGYGLEFKNEGTIKTPSGKDCLKNFASSNCSEHAVAYIDNHYEKFLNYLMTDSDGPGRFGSLHDELASYQCEMEINQFEEANKEFYLAKQAGKAYDRNESYFTPLYEDLEKCMLHYCFYTDENLFRLKQDYEEMVTYTKTGKYQKVTSLSTSKFDACLESIIITEISLKYDCVRQMMRLEPGTFISDTLALPLVNLSEFLADKECLRSVMEEHCWALMNFTTFDEDWKNHKNEMKLFGENLTGH